MSYSRYSYYFIFYSTFLEQYFTFSNTFLVMNKNNYYNSYKCYNYYRKRSNRYIFISNVLNGSLVELCVKTTVHNKYLNTM